MKEFFLSAVKNDNYITACNIMSYKILTLILKYSDKNL